MSGPCVICQPRPESQSRAVASTSASVMVPMGFFRFDVGVVHLSGEERYGPLDSIKAFGEHTWHRGSHRPVSGLLRKANFD